jgi:hypothetical protein
MKIISKSISLLVSLSILLSVEVLGTSPSEPQVVRINGTEVRLIHDSTQHLLVSIQCMLNQGGQWVKNDRCEAIKKLKILSLKKLKDELFGGANPGAVACQKVGGRSVIAVDSKMNQLSLCLFQDQSLASSGTLHYYARQNDL